MSAWILRFGRAGLFDFFHWRRPAPVAPRPASVPAPLSREVSERRAEAMRGFFPKLASWYEQRVYLSQMRDVDRFLAQSTDLVDLERRIRDIERSGTVSRWY